jgi:hypothetical protein
MTPMSIEVSILIDALTWAFITILDWAVTEKWPWKDRVVNRHSILAEEKGLKLFGQALKAFHSRKTIRSTIQSWVYPDKLPEGKFYLL